jgi:hypothetical protein
MDQILVRVKGLRKSPFFKLISDRALFERVTVDIGASPVYNPDHNLDEDSWFKIEDFTAKPYCIDLLKEEFDSVNYNDLTKDKFSKIAYLFAVQDNNFYFQKITPSLFVSKKMIAFGEVATIEESDNRLVINSQPDAVYFTDSNTLIFRNLAVIASIFKGVDELYKEATNEEVTLFLEESFIELANDYGVENVSKPNRKRIALAMTTLAAMSAQDRDSMPGYIESYCENKLKFDKDNSKFEITTDEELKLLLYGIEQRFYTTPFGQEKRLANSVQAIN